MPGAHSKAESREGDSALDDRIFKRDAYDERFLSSSVVTCGIEILSAYTAKFSR
jgi:hypothetical protein